MHDSKHGIKEGSDSALCARFSAEWLWCAVKGRHSLKHNARRNEQVWSYAAKVDIWVAAFKHAAERFIHALLRRGHNFELACNFREVVLCRRLLCAHRRDYCLPGVCLNFNVHKNKPRLV
ncbi:hypothetical protein A3H74_00290 [Candidatus Kaiserbacteria bacterium RIFCSPLOWO2_02_FULL_51_13]|nr:MAG: hypothetical protein A3H74_00290 [Candidatus Kaiserbacteria bacterium RIFCSPLOWO2_02_FULL_51_13]